MARAKGGGGPNPSAITAMLGMIPTATAGRFLAAEMRRDPDALKRFVAVVRNERRKRLQKDYRAETDRMLKRAAGKKGYIDQSSKLVKFSGPMKDAKDSEKIYDHAEAARIYGEVYEAIMENIERVYSGTGMFYRQANRCIEGMGRCAGEVRGTGERRGILSAMAALWIDDRNYNSSAFRKALVHGISSPEDAGHVASMIKARRRGGGSTMNGRDVELFLEDARKKVGKISWKGRR